MRVVSSYDYQRIAEAIEFIRANSHDHPGLDKIAASVNLSPYHFQRLFTKWAGVSPKQFQQYITLDFVKSRLRNDGPTLFDLADEAGLSGTGRLHDLFVTIEGMTPGEFRNEGRGMVINYNEYNSPFGVVLIASTPRGICYVGFKDSGAMSQLTNLYANAEIKQSHREIHDSVLRVFKGDWSEPEKIRLHLRATPFQLKTWQALLEIPEGQLMFYGELAKKVGRPTASRAVGTAIGKNPIAYVIPCHRVIRSSGEMGGYRWGVNRKRCILGVEAAANSRVQNDI